MYVISVWGSDPPEKAGEMLRWMATLSYRSIAEHASTYLSDPTLVGKTEEDAPAPVKNPKEAIFQVNQSIDMQSIDKSLDTKFVTHFYYLLPAQVTTTEIVSPSVVRYMR